MGISRIQHNLSAMNAMSNYQGNSKNVTGSLEKLSSGYRINSAADDAAGLAISEKMRSQIAGLQKAQDNANDGVSLVQTAEGALTEVNSMLTRLKTLATQSANGTYEDKVDRENIQEETDALLEEIDRISQSTNFNGINLLDGSLGNYANASAITTPTGTADNVGVYDKNSLTVSGGNLNAGDEFKVSLATGSSQAGLSNVKLVDSEGASIINVTAGTASVADQLKASWGMTVTTSVSANPNGGTTVSYTIKLTDEDKLATMLKTSSAGDANSYQDLVDNEGDSATKDKFDSVKRQIGSGITVSFTANKAATADVSADSLKFTTRGASKGDGTYEQTGLAQGAGRSLQIGDTNEDYQKINVSIKDMSSKGLGLEGLDLSTQEAAASAIDTIKEAVNRVSMQRGQLGALQNRLDHTLNNLDATEQNITAAESQIRDVDMAKEMTQFSKNNILVQAAQSMLAQANSQPQGVLSLLQ